MRQKTVIKNLLQSVTEVYYKMCQVLQSVTVIIKWDVTTFHIWCLLTDVSAFLSQFPHHLIKDRQGVRRIANDYPEYEWNVNGVKKLLKKIDETGSDAGRSKSALTKENIKLVK